VDPSKLIPVAVVCRRARIEPRLLTKYVSLGLAAPPTKRGRGKGGGRGSEAGWTKAQVELITEVAKRRKEGTRFPELCNIPVGVWLYSGGTWRPRSDDLAGPIDTPVEQVRRALRTWGKAASSRANKTTRIRKTARKLGALLSPDAGDAAEREWRAREIADFVEVEETTPLNEEPRREQALADVIDAFSTAPPGGKRQRTYAGPAELPIVPRNIILGRRAMLVAIENIDRFQAADLDLARHLILTDLGQYIGEQPDLAESPDGAAFYMPVTMPELLEDACQVLTRMLGYSILCPARVREVLATRDPRITETLRLRTKSLTAPLELAES
jgi:hypothetical protein